MKPLSSSSSELIMESNSMVSATLGRVMNTLLEARPKKLQDAISRLDSAPKIAPLGVSLEQSLRFLHKYIRDTLEEEDSLDQVLIPMIEHSLKLRDSKGSNQAMILLNWLFQDEMLFQALARYIAGIVSRKDDHFIALGWCTLARGLVEYEITMNKLLSNGIRDKYNALLKNFSSCIRHLLSVICNGSISQGGFELPTRLSVAAADFVLSLSVALTRTPMAPDLTDNKQKASNRNSQNRPISLSPAASSGSKMNTANKSSEFSSDMEMKKLLWAYLDELIILVQKLIAWSRKSRPLHVKGLERVHKWLLGTKQHYDCFRDQSDSKMMESGVLLLSSCWKHYGILLRLEDRKFSQQYKELLEQYMSGIQFYAENYSEEPKVNKESGTETIKFFLNCLSLLLGRLDGKQFETAITEYGSQLCQVLISQLRSDDEEVVDGTICILKAAIFRLKDHSVKSSPSVSREIDTVLPLLLPLLDERDGAAKAVVKLVAEYCSICSDSQCLLEVLRHLFSGNVSQRRNAVDVISDLIHISFTSANILSPTMWQDLANHLLDCLGDEESIIQTHASRLIPMIDPSLVLPALVRLMYSADERIRSSACNTFIAVLRNYKQKPEVICMLLDCLSNLCQNPGLPAAAGDRSEGTKLDIDRVLKLLPEWSKLVEDWNLLIGPLLDKMFVEPSNAVIVRFLSYISEYMADAADLVFNRLLSYTREQNNFDGILSKCEAGTFTNNESVKGPNSLFSHLCPLLIIRLLPLRVFDDLNSPLMYGQLLREHAMLDNGCLGVDEPQSVAALLMNRALNKFEFEDVRKLAAELCGRIHSHVLIPIISSQLERAANDGDVLKIKACLFSVCTSLMIRGKDSYFHADIFKIRNTIETILSWPSTEGDDVSKAQHGCIDCLALMVCAEVQNPKAFSIATSDGTCISGSRDAVDVASRSSVCSYVIDHLTQGKYPSMKSERVTNAMIRLPFRLCMANVLISTCQKISGSGRKALTRKILPCIIQSVEAINEPEIKAACVQVLFSVVYHLKSAVLPYSSDLLKIALWSLREGSHMEKMAGAKLLASLMASEETVIGSIAGGLLEARALLQHISSSDPSLDVREVCQKLLMCITSA